jgi:hypothetical protein
MQEQQNNKVNAELIQKNEDLKVPPTFVKE